MSQRMGPTLIGPGDFLSSLADEHRLEWERAWFHVMRSAVMLDEVFRGYSTIQDTPQEIAQHCGRLNFVERNWRIACPLSYSRRLDNLRTHCRSWRLWGVAIDVARSPCLRTLRAFAAQAVEDRWFHPVLGKAEARAMRLA